jgi:hypothetical protein
MDDVNGPEIVLELDIAESADVQPIGEAELDGIRPGEWRGWLYAPNG